MDPDGDLASDELAAMADQGRHRGSDMKHGASLEAGSTCMRHHGASSEAGSRACMGAQEELGNS